MAPWPPASALLLATSAWSLWASPTLAWGVAEEVGGDAGSLVKDPLVESLLREVERLGQEIDRIREDGGSSSPEQPAAAQPPPREQPGAASKAESCGRTLFLTLCVGTDFFDRYCGPLFASFERAYGKEAYEHRVVAFAANVEPRMLVAAAQRFAPWARIEVFELGGSAYPVYEPGAQDSFGVECDPEATPSSKCWVNPRLQHLVGMHRVGANTLIKFRQAAAYIADYGHDFDCVVVMDSDILFVRPLGRSLAELGPQAAGEGAWDMALTAYDERFTAPWAREPADVGRTKNGLVRVNSGVAIFRLRDLGLVVRLLNRWSKVSEALLTGGFDGPLREVDGAWKVWQEELMDEFGGNDPAALVLLLSSYSTERLVELLGWGRCEACDHAVEADVRLFEQEEPITVRFRALPARTLNHPESMDGGAFPADLALVHLKGPWWRAVSEGALLSFSTRQAAWNRDSLALYSLAFHEWQFALPPDLRAQAFIALRATSCDQGVPHGLAGARSGEGAKP